MTVSWRHILAAGTGLAALSVAGIGIAVAGGSGSGHVVSVPGVTVGTPTNATTSGCCTAGKSHGIYPPGVTIPGPNLVINHSGAQVGSQYIIEEGSTLESGIVVETADARTTFFANGSYIPMAPPIEPSTLDLSVKGTKQVREIVTEQVPVQEEVCVDKIVEQLVIAPVQAVCLDDTGTPHPASRVDDSQQIASGYDGEVFRCVAGTAMQVTIGQLIQGQVDFSQASGFSCAKGEALAHRPGGELVCAPQIPQRNCNERSLLRKYGPGLKLIEARIQKTVCEPTIQTHYETVQREVVKEVPLPSAPILLDGGVGQSITY